MMRLLVWTSVEVSLHVSQPICLPNHPNPSTLNHNLEMNSQYSLTNPNPSMQTRLVPSCMWQPSPVCPMAFPNTTKWFDVLLHQRAMIIVLVHRKHHQPLSPCIQGKDLNNSWNPLSLGFCCGVSESVGMIVDEEVCGGNSWNLMIVVGMGSAGKFQYGQWKMVQIKC